ncbi:hypothetical protein F8388_018431 [Cannabis sativa]|uniref:DUF1985 domain-containing protein n=1 Tax=Cannabis sativa TaxID=3483 RepID=A0A7J6F284_CANSA|nr:hypothetical protein F8388_018431 [Cannabis sativa]
MMQMGISDSGVTLKEIPSPFVALPSFVPTSPATGNFVPMHHFAISNQPRFNPPPSFYNFKPKKAYSLEAAVHRSLPKMFCEQENTEHESINKPLHPTCHRFPVVCYLPCLFAVVKRGCKEANFFSDCLQLVNAIKNSTFWLPHSANSVAHNLAAWAASHNVARPLLERELVDEYERELFSKSVGEVAWVLSTISISISVVIVIANMTKVSPMKKAQRASSSRHNNKKSVVSIDLGAEKFTSDDSRIYECNSNGNELQLSFNSNKVKFSIAEFGIITGKELAECLMKTRIDDDDDDVVKLTKVFIMHNILQNKRGQCHVDNFVMKLVDDEQMFENYPWGHRSFNDTVNSLSTILNRQKIGYEICGFPLAFQVWGFEILPSLGSSFVIKISCVPWAPVDDNRSTTAEQIRLNHDSSSPRMNDIRTNLQKRD